MGAPPVSASALRDLPAPSIMSPPRTTVVVAVGGTDPAAIASSMPKLHGLMEGKTSASVTHERRAEDGASSFCPRGFGTTFNTIAMFAHVSGVLGFTVDRVFHGLSALVDNTWTTPYTACVSAVEVGTTLPLSLLTLEPFYSTS